MYQRRLVRIAVLASAVAGFLATSAEASSPKTVAVTPHPIEDLIVAGGKAAWCSQFGDVFGAYPTGEIWVHDLGTGSRVKLASPTSSGDYSEWALGGLLAFDGDRAVWWELNTGPRDYEPEVFTVALSDRHEVVLQHYGDGEDWDWTVDVWAIEPDGTPLIYGAGAELRLVKGRKDRRVPRIPTHTSASATKSRIVIVRSDTGAVELRRLPGGKRVRTIPVDGSARAVSLTPRLVTVLVERAGKLRLARYRLSGELLGSTAAPPNTRPRLDADGKWVVFRAGNRVFALNGETGKVTGLRDLGYPPRDLQASGGRVYWAINWGGHGHIHSMALPFG